VFILKEVKVVCFDTLLQVLILKAVVEERFRRRSFPLDKSSRCLIEAFKYPPPGCFAKRGCKCLILKDGSAEKRAKRLQECDSEGVSLAGGCGGRVSCRDNMREVIISVYRLSSTFWAWT
jgi:hypothetical protein